MNRKLILLIFFLILFLHISADLSALKSAVNCRGTCLKKWGIECGGLCCSIINCLGWLNPSCAPKTAIDIGGCNMTLPR